MENRLNELLPNKKQHKTANGPASENLTATSFDYEFFTSVAEKVCGHYKSKTRLPNILTPRVALNYYCETFEGCSSSYDYTDHVPG